MMQFTTIKKAKSIAIVSTILTLRLMALIAIYPLIRTIDSNLFSIAEQQQCIKKIFCNQSGVEVGLTPGFCKPQ